MSDNNHPHHECIAMFEKLSEYIDNDLDAVTCKDIEQHAKSCVACQACIATLKQTIALCKTISWGQALIGKQLAQNFFDRKN
jgi:anti-sigma factor RsiW